MICKNARPRFHQLYDLGQAPSSVFKTDDWENQGKLECWLHSPFLMAMLPFLLRLVRAPQFLVTLFQRSKFLPLRVSRQWLTSRRPDMTRSPFLFPHSLFDRGRRQTRIMSLSPADPQASTHNFSSDSPVIFFSTTHSVKQPDWHFLVSVLQD